MFQIGEKGTILEARFATTLWEVLFSILDTIRVLFVDKGVGLIDNITTGANSWRNMVWCVSKGSISRL